MQCKFDPERLSLGAATKVLERAIVTSPLGDIVVVFEGDALAGLYFLLDQKYVPPLVCGLPIASERPIVKAVRVQVTRYFDASASAGASASTGAGECTSRSECGHALSDAPFDLPLHLRGTPFQLRVWEALLAIPCGETRTYGWIAESIGSSSAIRAVGAAIGRNPISIVVPCHRVLGANGSLTGFAGGIARKARLLEIEGTTAQASLEFDRS